MAAIPDFRPMGCSRRETTRCRSPSYSSRLWLSVPGPDQMPKLGRRLAGCPGRQSGEFDAATLAGWDHGGFCRRVFCGGQGSSERHRRVFRVRPGSPEERGADARAKPSGSRQGLDVGSVVTQAVPRVSEETASDVAPLPRRAVSARSGVGLGSGIRDKHGHELEFPSAFRQSRRDGTPRGIVKIRHGGSV